MLNLQQGPEACIITQLQWIFLRDERVVCAHMPSDLRKSKLERDSGSPDSYFGLRIICRRRAW